MTDITELAQRMKAAAKKATPGPWEVQFGDEIYATDGVDNEQVAIATLDARDADFIALANPANILALVEALEKAQRANGHLREQSAEWERKAISNFEDCAEMSARIEELESQRKLAFTASNRWADKFREAEKRIAEMEPISAAAEKLVRCKGRYHSEQNYRALAALFGVTTPDLPPLEHENVHYADAAEMEIAALRQRIAELESCLESADKLQDSAFRSGLQHGFSLGQTDDQKGYEQSMAAYSPDAAIKWESA